VAIIDTHGKDLTVSTDTSRTGTPVPTAAPAAAKAATAAAPSAPVKKPQPKTVNTTTLTVEATFKASADDLFSILTDEKRIPSWSRAPAKVGEQFEQQNAMIEFRLVDCNSWFGVLLVRRRCQW
jgi:activator of HSP90 ATPase